MHNNDAGTTLHEMIKFSNAIDSVLDWMKGRDDTLLIVSADYVYSSGIRKNIVAEVVANQSNVVWASDNH